MYNLILQRIEALRAFMTSQGLSAFIFPSTDPHCGEYIPEHWETRRWISGFNGSAGTVVITTQEAFLWTDSRYYLAAEAQLSGTTIRLMKDGLPDTPSIAEWLSAHLLPGDCVGLDGQVNSITFVESLQDALRANGISICTEHDPAQVLWTDRPSIPTNPVEIQPSQTKRYNFYKTFAVRSTPTASSSPPSTRWHGHSTFAATTFIAIRSLSAICSLPHRPPPSCSSIPRNYPLRFTPICKRHTWKSVRTRTFSPPSLHIHIQTSCSTPQPPTTPFCKLCPRNAALCAASRPWHDSKPSRTRPKSPVFVRPCCATEWP